MLTLNLATGRAPVAVSFRVDTKAGEVETTFGADVPRVFLEFAVPDRSLRVRVEPADGPRLAQREAGEEGAVTLSIDGEPAVRLLVRDQAVYDKDGAAPFTDPRLAELYGPLRELAEALPDRRRQGPDRLRQGPDRARASVAEFDDGYWDCVGQYTSAGAELGGTVGSFPAGSSASWPAA